MRVLIIREEHLWVAQCLEHDIAAQAQSLRDVKLAFAKTFAAQVAVALATNQDPAEFIRSFAPAPESYHRLFAEAERLLDPIQAPEPVNIPPAFMIDPIQRSIADGRVYA